MYGLEIFNRLKKSKIIIKNHYQKSFIKVNCSISVQVTTKLILKCIKFKKINNKNIKILGNLLAIILRSAKCKTLPTI